VWSNDRSFSFLREFLRDVVVLGLVGACVLVCIFLLNECDQLREMKYTLLTKVCLVFPETLILLYYWWAGGTIVLAP
jgi:hypothetical protein